MTLGIRMKLVSIVTACYNEEDNVEEIYARVKEIFRELPQYRYEHIFIDNNSEDRTVERLKRLAEQDRNLKIIVNTRNFGHIRSPVYGLLQAKGDAVISIVADFQDPPEMIKDFLREWESGYKIVVGVKLKSTDLFFIRAAKNFYYSLIGKISRVQLIKNFTGFGLYDQEVMKALRHINDPYPYFRGMICEIGYPIKEIIYHQPARKRGISKNNFFTLYDMAILGITSHSKTPIHLATIGGFILAILSLLLSLVFLILKLIFWSSFGAGIAPILISLFFFSSVQLFFIGIIGEYIGAIQTQQLKRPLVYEKERINFME